MLTFFACLRTIVDDGVRYSGVWPNLPGLMLRTTKDIANVIIDYRDRKEGRPRYTLRKLISPDVQIGWTSIVSLMMYFGGVILVVLGLIGEYMGRIYLSINATPQYVIKETIGF